MNSFLYIPELVDRVIDFIHYDKQSLRSYSLVGRLWTVTAQLHYFHSVTVILHADQCIKLLNTIRSRPRIGAHIRRLTISKHTLPLNDAHGRYQALMRAIPGLVQLVLHSVIWFNTKVPPSEDSPSHPPLQSITIAYQNYRNGPEFVSLARTLPSTELLRIIRSSFEGHIIGSDELGNSSSLTSSRLSAKELFADVNDNVNPAALDYILDNRSPQTLTCGITWYSGLGMIRALCMQFRDRIRNLHVYMASLVSYDGKPSTDSSIWGHTENVLTELMESSWLSERIRLNIPALEAISLTMTARKGRAASGCFKGNLILALMIMPTMFSGAYIKTIKVDLGAVAEDSARPIEMDGFDWNRAQSACRSLGSIRMRIFIKATQRECMWVQATIAGLLSCESEGIVQYVFI